MSSQAIAIPGIAYNETTGIQLNALKAAKFPPTFWSLTPRDCILYNLGLGAKTDELQYVFEGNEKFHVIPTYACIPGMLGVGTVTRYMPEFLKGFNVGFGLLGREKMGLVWMSKRLRDGR